MSRSILSLTLCTIFSAFLLSACKEKKKNEVLETEPKTQYGKAVHEVESLKDEIGHKSTEMNEAMNEASSDE